VKGCLRLTFLPSALKTFKSRTIKEKTKPKDKQKCSIQSKILTSFEDERMA